MNTTIARFAHACLALLLVQACGSEDDATIVQTRAPALVVLMKRNLQPEGIEYDAARNRFLVGSLTENTIYAVADDGALSPAATSPEIATTVGLEVDEARDQLVAAATLANGAPGVAFFDLATGNVLRAIDLSTLTGGVGFINDVTVDSGGNAYVTNTLRGAVYRIAPDDSAETLAEGSDLAAANGIEIFDDTTLIVATLSGPALIRIPIDRPQERSPVSTAVAVTGDGIARTPSGDLAVVSFVPTNTVLLFRSDDGWQTAQRVGTWDGSSVSTTSPTTAAVRGDDVHVVFAHLGDESNDSYEIARADFE